MFCSSNGYKARVRHLDGVAARRRASSRSTLSYGIADANGNGLLADDVKAHLCATAATASYPATTDARYPNWYGCGIVDADNALITVPPPGGGAASATTARSPRPTARPSPRTAARSAIDVLANDTDPDAGHDS